MDRQIEFLQVWAAACQPIVERYIFETSVFGPVIARQNIMLRNHEYNNTHSEGIDLDTDDGLAAGIICIAASYVQLMVAYGVLD